MKSAFLIAAPNSGSGKTTIARGLMKLFTDKGFKVQPFKCGPDYIDTKFHQSVCGRPSVNLDTFMSTPAHVRELFWHYGADADICIVEGMMGLFDGYDRDLGSSYEIARELDIPVVLVVDAKSSAYSMAALLSGFIHFRKDINIAGIIFNKVGSERHYKMLQELCEELHVRCIGYLPKSTDLEQNSRYLGLDFSQVTENTSLHKLLEEHLDLSFFSSDTIPKKPIVDIEKGNEKFLNKATKVLVAKNDESFSFIYQEVLDHFGNFDFFNPERDFPELDGIDLLYLPGGYPEKHLEPLTANQDCLHAIKRFAEGGGKVVAECGGMMYLCQEIITDDGAYPMCGVLPYSISARKTDRKLSLGYRQFTLDGKNYRGHEFHYTQFVGDTPKSITQVYNAKGDPVPTPVFRYHHVLASYTHLYQIPCDI